jgi:hypothetical protein
VDGLEHGAVRRQLRGDGRVHVVVDVFGVTVHGLHVRKIIDFEKKFKSRHDNN